MYDKSNHADIVSDGALSQVTVEWRAPPVTERDTPKPPSASWGEKYTFRFLQNWNEGVRMGLGLSRRSIVEGLEPV